MPKPWLVSLRLPLRPLEPLGGHPAPIKHAVRDGWKRVQADSHATALDDEQEPWDSEDSLLLRATSGSAITRPVPMSTLAVPMATEAFEYYLGDESRRGDAPESWPAGAAGGAPCGDLVRLSLRIDDGRIAESRFDAEGCAGSIAAGAAVAELVEDRVVLDAARLGPHQLSEALGGLSPQGYHAAELATDALHRTLTAAVGSGAELAPPDEGTRPQRVLVAMSGGVDSAVAAWLERERGAEVIAVTLKLWADQRTDGERSCCSPQAVLGARALAHSIDLPHLTMDLEESFRATVVEDFVAGYAAGRTPNPCVRCNGMVRLDAMIGLAARLGATTLVTGHYARIVDDGEGPLLVAPADEAKDQTYMLAGVRPRSLARLRFPLADLTKPAVRRIAADAGLPVASKKESQDLCFLAGEGKRSFLARHGGLDDRPGDITERSGRVLARHRGHHHFTVGQRRGLGVASPQPLYVLETDADSNRVVVGSRDELAIERVRLRDAVLHRDGRRVDRVKLRYRSRPLPGRVEASGDGVVVRLAEPAYGVAPGQTACLLDGDLVVGHGVIT
jgi:tRNA-specific 2-thiouridylase